LVLDPFNGSGTTGIVSNMYGRKYIGIDLENKYLDLTIKRLDSLKSKIVVPERAHAFKF